LKRRLNLIDSIKVASNSFIFVGDFVVTGDKLPLKVRLNLNNKTVVFQISLKVVNGGFDNSPVRQEVIQEFLLATVNFFADWNDSFLLESDQ
jgi:metal-dependent HD superfamily phosphatase/phosphodiesterase